jgi:hypothetical protein
MKLKSIHFTSTALFFNTAQAHHSWVSSYTSDLITTEEITLRSTITVF